MRNIPTHIIQKLEVRNQSNSLRTLSLESQLINFCSNDYLGFSTNNYLSQLIDSEYDSLKYKFPTGATGSRLVSGNTSFYEQTEQYLAQFYKAKDALIFNSGYVANMGVLSSIPQKGDTIFYDELSHACIKDGARISAADRFSFKHNDLNDLERRLKSAKGNVYVAVESVYSMDGDFAPLKELVLLCKKFGAFLIVDEAHSTGILGDNGSGLVCELGLESEIFCRIHTFGKAMGTHGACVVGTHELKSFLINFSRPFIYTTALPLHTVCTIKCNHKYLFNNQILINLLHENIKLFTSQLSEFAKSKMIPSQSAIQALIVEGNVEVKQKAKYLAEQGFLIKPILSPTVKEGQERLRICIRTTHKQEEIIKLATLL